MVVAASTAPAARGGAECACQLPAPPARARLKGVSIRRRAAEAKGGVAGQVSASPNRKIALR
jgi:hypothetical protein